MSDWKATACILCECNCGLEVQTEGRRLVRLRGDKAHPVSRGYACEKAHRLDFYQNGRDRLTSPLRRRADGSFEAVDWDTAIAEVAARLAAVRDAHGGASIFYYGGGGQGNHLPGAYATATRAALESRYRSSALAQEKTGEFWIADRMMGGTTRADFEHCEVGLFLGKNPWHSHSIPRARVTLKAMAKDPARTLVVIDPRVTETAALADVHLQLRPGTDAWLLSAMVAVLFEEDLVDEAFLEGRADGLDAVRAHFRGVDVPACCAVAGIDEARVREVVRRIAGAASFASFEDLGIQMNRNSTVVSYLHRLLWMLTGSFGRPGTHYVPTPLVNFTSGASKRRSPVTEAPIIGGMIPCNTIPEEILTDHPARFRAMLVEAANPAHSLADGPRMREALRALDCLVVIDVAMTETAKLADYVLPSATQYEKAEATFFNFEFPENAFHLRPRLFEPLEGTLPEAEIHARLCEALGAYDEDDLAPLREAAERGALGPALFGLMANPGLARLAPVLLYRSLGETLPAELKEGAVVYGLALRRALESGASLARAGLEGGGPQAAEALFAALLEHPSGVVFAKDRWEDQKPPKGRFVLALPDMLEALAGLDPEEGRLEGFPFVLSAGERRSFTANTIIRDPAWRRKDPDGALRISPQDASALGVQDGGRVRLTTPRGSAEVPVEVNPSMQPGHLSLPNGLGTAYPDGAKGVSPNELTSLDARDPFVGTPWHKAVPARLEALRP